MIIRSAETSSSYSSWSLLMSPQLPSVCDSNLVLTSIPIIVTQFPATVPDVSRPSLIVAEDVGAERCGLAHFGLW